MLSTVGIINVVWLIIYSILSSVDSINVALSSGIDPMSGMLFPHFSSSQSYVVDFFHVNYST